MSNDALKRLAANAALEMVPSGCTIGVGTGSTVNCFIEALAKVRAKIEAAVASSIATEKLLRDHGIPVIDLNSVDNLALYVDGADEFNPYLSLLKGGGGALTREKIIAAASRKFVCITDESKKVSVLGRFPLAIEVIPMARSYVGRQLVRMGGDPVYREGFVTDNGNIIIDVHNFRIETPIAMEEQLNNITGVVAHGIFAKRGADVVLMATESGEVVRFGE